MTKNSTDFPDIRGEMLISPTVDWDLRAGNSHHCRYIYLYKRELSSIYVGSGVSVLLTGFSAH